MSVNNRVLKVYVVGSAKSYASFLNHVLVDTMEEADVVLFTGGSDVNPTLYKQAKGKFTSPSVMRDISEVGEAEIAMKLGKPIIGTCRGAQLGCVMSGGLLVQHMNHPHMHNLTMYDGTTIQVNSLHHQLQKPGNLHPIEYVVAGWAKGLSNIYLDGNDNDCILPSRVNGKDEYVIEAEVVYYRKTNWLGWQHHPEMMSYNATATQLMRRMTHLLVDGTLDTVLTMNIPTSRYLTQELILKEDEIQMYEALVSKRKEVELSVSIN